MAVQMREPVTTTSACSAAVTDGAVRLFLAGYLERLRFDGEEDGHPYYQIPSESRRGVVYTIAHDPIEKTVRCSCPAGMHHVPCKHVRLLQLRNGGAVQQTEAHCS